MAAFVSACGCHSLFFLLETTDFQVKNPPNFERPKGTHFFCSCCLDSKQAADGDDVAVEAPMGGADRIGGEGDNDSSTGMSDFSSESSPDSIVCFYVIFGLLVKTFLLE